MTAGASDLSTQANGPATLEARLDLLRDFVFEVLAPVEHDSAAARHCLANDDDAGARYHLKRAVASIKAAAATFSELEEIKAQKTASGESEA